MRRRFYANARHDDLSLCRRFPARTSIQLARPPHEQLRPIPARLRELLRRRATLPPRAYPLRPFRRRCPHAREDASSRSAREERRSCTGYRISANVDLGWRDAQNPFERLRGGAPHETPSLTVVASDLPSSTNRVELTLREGVDSVEDGARAGARDDDSVVESAPVRPIEPPHLTLTAASEEAPAGATYLKQEAGVFWNRD